MHKRIIQATAAAMFFASIMAIPVYAQGNDNKGNNGNHFGLEMRLLASEKHDLKIKHEDGDEDDDNDNRSVIASCLKAAEEAHKAALKPAREAKEASLKTARTAFHAAHKTAQEVRKAAIKDARVTFRASDHGVSARAAFEVSVHKSLTDRQAAISKAQDTWTAAKVAAQTAWKTAKEKADADFKAAKDKCKNVVPPVVPPIVTDTIVPSAVANLALSNATNSSVVLTWTSTGDDAATGTAASTDIRYSTSAITAANFAGATQVSGEPIPAVAGTSQSMTVSGLSGSTTYYFAMKSQDEAANVSLLSNVATMTTLPNPDVTAPSAVTNLSLSAPTTTSLIVAWTAPGDDAATGTAATYDIRYSTSPIATAADFTAATQVTGEPAPSAAGTSQSMTVSGLTTGTTYYFVMKSQDEVPNVSVTSNVASMATL